MNIQRYLLAAAMVTLVACDGLGTSSAEQEVVSTDLTAYQTGNNVVVNYSNMGGAATDWISLSQTTDVDSAYEAWQFTGGGTSGTLTFTSPHLSPGTYEARAYYDWAGTNSFTVQQRSPSFSVGGSATVTPSMPSYTFASDVVINYTNFSGSTTDWVGIFPPGAPNDPSGYVAWQYTGGPTNGSLTFSGLAAGTYEARYFADWAGSHSFAPYVISSQFSVGSMPAITTDHPQYGQGEMVNVIYSNMPGNMLDYVAVSIAGSADTATVQRAYINGNMNGTQAFAGLAAGNYEARAYVNDTSTIIAMSTFSVTGTTVTTDATSYNGATPVTVMYAGMPGNMADYVSVAVVGSPDSTYTQFAYTMGQTTGMAQFSGLPVGTYEARAYFNNTFIVQARSAPFTVAVACTAPTQMPVLSSFQTGDLVIDVSTNTATASMTVALDSSILFTSVSENEPSPGFGGVACDLTTAGVVCHKYLAGTDSASSTGSVTIHWTVVTFSSGVSVQRGTSNTNAANPTTVALSPVDPASTFILMGGEFGGGTGWGNNEFMRGQLIDGSTLDIRNAIAGSTISWQVVTMVGASVQRGTTSFASTDLEQVATIGTAPSGSLPLASYTTANQTGIAAAALMMQTSLTDATTLDFSRSLGGTALDVSWEVVSLPYATTNATASFAAGSLTSTQSVTGILPASAVGIANSQGVLGQAGGSTTYNGTDIDLLGEGAASVVVSNGSVTLTRGTAQSSATIPWTVIDFAHNCAGQ